MFTTTTQAVAKGSRLNDLRTILESRRIELLHELHDKIRDVRSDGISDRDVLDAAETLRGRYPGRDRIRVDAAEGGDAEEDRHRARSN